MTLLEVMMGVSIMTIVMGSLFGMSIAMGDAARLREERSAAFDEARKAMLFVTRELRQASNSSISVLPAGTITYSVATDMDGNGFAVDVGGNCELSTPRTVTRDVEDLNNDGITDTQVVMTVGDVVLVLANRVMQDEDINRNGLLDDGEDANENGRLDRGVWFERTETNGVRIIMQTRGHTRKGQEVSNRFETTVLPRN